jgi:hypothetical protein
MSPIKALPSLDWSDTAFREITLTGDELVQQSDCAYRLGNIGVCGLIYRSYLSPPWLWFALTKGVSVGDLLDFKRRLEALIPHGTLTGIRADFKSGIRFARFYGFVATGAIASHGGYDYEIYRRA